jgi:predicted RNase H-like HicB family nuclease
LQSTISGAGSLIWNVSHRQRIGVKRKFTIVIERRGDEYVAHCPEVADVVAHGRDTKDALEKIRTAIIKKLREGGSDTGSAPFPHPVSPPPRGPHGPIMMEAEIDDGQNNG